MTHSEVTIQITPTSLPSRPSWMGEVAAFAQVLTCSGARSRVLLPSSLLELISLRTPWVFAPQKKKRNDRLCFTWYFRPERYKVFSCMRYYVNTFLLTKVGKKMIRRMAERIAPWKEVPILQEIFAWGYKEKIIDEAMPLHSSPHLSLYLVLLVFLARFGNCAMDN